MMEWYSSLFKGESKKEPQKSYIPLRDFADGADSDDSSSCTAAMAGSSTATEVFATSRLSTAPVISGRDLLISICNSYIERCQRAVSSAVTTLFSTQPQSLLSKYEQIAKKLIAIFRKRTDEDVDNDALVHLFALSHIGAVDKLDSELVSNLNKKLKENFPGTSAKFNFVLYSVDVVVIDDLKAIILGKNSSTENNIALMKDFYGTVNLIRELAEMSAMPKVGLQERLSHSSPRQTRLNPLTSGPSRRAMIPTR